MLYSYFCNSEAKVKTLKKHFNNYKNTSYESKRIS